MVKIIVFVSIILPEPSNITRDAKKKSTDHSKFKRLGNKTFSRLFFPKTTTVIKQDEK